MGSVTVGQANVSPIELGRRREADAGLRRRPFGRHHDRSEIGALAPVRAEHATEPEIVRSLLEVAHGGGGLVLSGEQGITTTLLDATESAALAMGMRVVRVNSAELEADIGRAMRVGSGSILERVGLPALRPRRLGDASQMLMDACRLDPELRAATARGADLLHNDGEVDAAHRVLVAAIESSLNRTNRDVPAVVEALHTLSVVCHFGGRAELWAPFQHTLDLLGDVVPPVLRLIARTCPDPVAASAAALIELDRHINRLQAGDPDPAQTVHIGMAAYAVDRLPDCRNALRRVFLGSGEESARDWAVRAGLLLARDAVDAGQWAEAETLAEQCIGLCESNGQRFWAWSGRYVLALVAAGRGQWNVCRALTDEMVEWATPRGVLQLVHDAHHARFLASLGRGDHDDALFDAGAVMRQGAVRVEPAVLRSSLNVVEAAVRTRRFAAATTHASLLADASVAGLSPRLALQAASAEALVAPDELAAELFQAALDIPGIERWPFEVARVQLAFGERLRRRQATRASREQLTTALETFTRLGARPWAERASAELQATGQTRRRSDGTGPAPLTPQELGIAELAATGLTNKQIGVRLYLSPRTVSAHLYRVFPKLGITSRAALRDALHASK